MPCKIKSHYRFKHEMWTIVVILAVIQRRTNIYKLVLVYENMGSLEEKGENAVDASVPTR